jgi:hypothetical protein
MTIPLDQCPYSKDRWRVGLSSIGDGLIVKDRFGAIGVMNPIAESLTHLANDARGKPLLATSVENKRRA